MLATATGLSGWGYNLVLTLHVLCVITGFGVILLNGIWGSSLSKLTGDAAAAMGATLRKVSNVAEGFVYAVPVFGILAVVLSDKAHQFKAPWVSASFALYIVGIGISHGVLRPQTRKLFAWAAEGNPATEERAATEKKVAAVSGVLHLVFAAILLLMVFGPTTSWLLP